MEKNSTQTLDELLHGDRWDICEYCGHGYYDWVCGCQVKKTDAKKLKEVMRNIDKQKKVKK